MADFPRRALGAGGPLVPALGYGCLSFGGNYGPADPAEAARTLDAAWDAGLRHFDVANIYGAGLCETILGDWLSARGHRDAVVATKAGIVTGPQRGADNRPAYLRAELEGSLRRLRRDHVALFYIHRRDPRVPLADVAGLAADLIAEGKIGAWGLSEVSPATLRAAHAATPVAAVQSEYSLWTRLPELGLLQATAALGVAFVAFSPLARGMFGERPVTRAQIGPADFRHANPRFVEPNLTVNEGWIAPFRAFARSRGWPVAALALAWVLDRGDHVVAIPGTRHAGHLAEWLPAAGIRLTDADRAAIDRLLPAGFAQGDRYAPAQTAGVETYG